jgi:thioredoxin:protein disulfide reductase
MIMNSLYSNLWRDSKEFLRALSPNQGARVTRLAAFALFFAAFGFASFSFAQENALTLASSVLKPQAYVSLQPVPRGRLFEVAVVSKISSGFHINAHEPSEEYLIPTKITADLPSGVLLVVTTYPRGVMRTFRFSKTPLRVYEDSFTVRMKLRAANSASIGPQKIALTVGYQACNQDSCLPPTQVPVTAQLEIADEDTPAHPANLNIFAPASASKATSHH